MKMIDADHLRYEPNSQSNNSNCNKLVDNLLLLGLRACLFALLINLPKLVIFFESNGYSPYVLNSPTDESLYLRAAIDQGNFLSHTAIYFEHAKPLSFLRLLTTWRPDQTFSHFVVGWLSNCLSFKINELNLVLDLICGALAYLIMALFFTQILGKIHAPLAEIASLVFLAYPWEFSLENWFQIHPLLPGLTTVLPNISDSVLPIQEGVESQLSLVWFAIGFLLYSWVRKHDLTKQKAIILLGAFLGTFIYGYVLSWLAASVLLGGILFFELGLSSNSVKTFSFGKSLKALLLFTFANLTTALLGIAQIFLLRESKGIFVDDLQIYRSVFYFPTEWLCLLLVSLLTTFILSKRGPALYKIIFIWITSAILAEFILLNIQPIFGFATVGIFIVGTFTRPFLTSTIFILLFLPVSGDREFRIYYRLLLLTLLTITGLDRARSESTNSTTANELTELTMFLRNHLPDRSVLAMITFHKPFQPTTKEWHWRTTPNLIAAMTENYLIKESLGLEWGVLSAEETIARELALGTIFTGKPQLIRSCIEEEIIIEPKSLFFQQWIAIQLSRRKTCHITRELIKNETSCGSMGRYKIDYIIWEKEFRLPFPEYLSHSSSVVWESADKNYTVLKLDQPKAIKFLCATSK